jgi:hypothetical protein
VQAWTNSVPEEIKAQVGDGLEKYYDELILKGYEPDKIEALMQTEGMIDLLKYSLDLVTILEENGGKIPDELLKKQVSSDTNTPENTTTYNDDGELVVRITKGKQRTFKDDVASNLEQADAILSKLPEEDVALAFDLASMVIGGPVKLVVGKVADKAIQETVGDDIAKIAETVNKKSAEYLYDHRDGAYDEEDNSYIENYGDTELSATALGLKLLGSVTGIGVLSKGGIKSKRDSSSEGGSEGTMLGSNGTQTSSKTLWKGNGKERIDVENPNPGQRPGQVHYQDIKNNKYLYDPKTNSFPGAPKSVNKMLKDKKFKAAIDKAMTKYLGE